MQTKVLGELVYHTKELALLLNFYLTKETKYETKAKVILTKLTQKPSERKTIALIKKFHKLSSQFFDHIIQRSESRLHRILEIEEEKENTFLKHLEEDLLLYTQKDNTDEIAKTAMQAIIQQLKVQIQTLNQAENDIAANPKASDDIESLKQVFSFKGYTKELKLITKNQENIFAQEKGLLNEIKATLRKKKSFSTLQSTIDAEDMLHKELSTLQDDISLQKEFLSQLVQDILTITHIQRALIDRFKQMRAIFIQYLESIQDKYTPKHKQEIKLILNDLKDNKTNNNHKQENKSEKEN